MNDRATILRETIQVLHERGWVKGGGNALADTGPLCLAQAINHVRGVDQVSGWHSCHDVLGHDTDSVGFGSPRRPWIWNDNARDVEEVIALLDFLATTNMSWDDAMDLWFAAQEKGEPLVATQEPVVA